MNSIQLSNVDSPQKAGVNGPDARRIRKAIFRRTIDYNAAVITYLKDRIWQRSSRSRRAIQPDYLYNSMLNIPSEYLDTPMNCVTGKPVRTSTNKNKCPIYCVCWTPEGRRLITGAYSGEFTLWNGLTFNFETILQAHESQIRCMKWSHNDEWLLTADHAGYVKYWQANMNNVEMYQAHKEPIRGVSFSPFDTKFVTCSDDSTVRIWDFLRCTEERVLRGHGSDVRSVAWHPHMSLIISGSKDAQQPIKLWEPKTGESIATLYVHKNTCTDVAWNRNGNWFLTASRDHLIKLFDLRYMKSELQTFRGHKRDVMRLAWHPCHEGLFASGSADGAILFWSAGTETELGAIDDAHESMIWSLAWHPLGHILVSGANDFATKFWTRNRPGDILKDIIGSENSVCLPAIPSDGIIDHDEVVKTVADQVSDEVGGSLARALADAAGRLPIFESSEITLPIPPLPTIEKKEVNSVFSLFENEFAEETRTVEIPGLNEGTVSDMNVGDMESEDAEKIKSRQIRSIPKEFIANWSSTRLKQASNIVLSAVAQNQHQASSSTEEANVSTTELSTGSANTDQQDDRSLNAPAVSSDMHASRISTQAVAEEKCQQLEEEENRSNTHKMQRKFDSAAREEDMLAFANGLNLGVPTSSIREQRPNHQIQTIQRFGKPMVGPRPQLPIPMIHPQAVPINRFREVARFPVYSNMTGTPEHNQMPPPSLGSNPPMLREYPIRLEDDSWQNFKTFSEHPQHHLQQQHALQQQYPREPHPHQMQQQQRSGHWRPDAHQLDRGFHEVHSRPHFRPPISICEQWPGCPPAYNLDNGSFVSAPKRPSLGRHIVGSRPEPWQEPQFRRGGWQ